MRAIELRSRGGFDGLVLTERATPEPGPGKVLVRIAAASLNYRDIAIAQGSYGDFALPIVPVSDGAGEVVAVGDGVENFAPGDRVSPHYVVDWTSGPPSAEVVRRRLGGPLDGVLSEHFLASEHALVRIPAHMSFAQGATLPIAGLTAWQALFETGPLRPGDVVVAQGTGGVATFVLQLARLAGARVIVLSASEAKAVRATALGAERVIDYRQRPEWHTEVLEATDGRGADVVVDVVGGEGITRSIAAARIGGRVSLVGFLDDMRAGIDLPRLFARVVSLHAVSVGNRTSFEALVRACEAGRLEPVIDQVFPLESVREAYAHVAAARHMGKVVVDLE